jgi:glucosylceramidase
VHGKLKDSMRDLWADYFLKFFEAYQAEGIQFWATTLQNEAARSGFWGATEMQTWQTMYYTPQEEAEFLKVLGPKLAESQFTHLKIIGHDDQTSNLVERLNPILEDREAAKYLDGVGIHWYQNTVANGFIENNYPQIQQLVPSLNDESKYRFILGTEACNGYMPNTWFFNLFGGNQVSGPLLGNWNRGELYAADIIKTMSLGASGWTDWNLALNMKGGPNWANNLVDAPILIDSKQQQYYLQPMFFYLGHFSKFVRPGAQILKMDSWDPLSQGTSAIAFKVPAYSIHVDPETVNIPETTVFIVMNQSLMTRNYRIDLPNGKFIYGDIDSNSIQTIVFKSLN